MLGATVGFVARPLKPAAGRARPCTLGEIPKQMLKSDRWEATAPASNEYVLFLASVGRLVFNLMLFRLMESRGIELTRSRPYRKNDQAWIEQKNGAIVRKLLGYRRFEGLAAARAITRLYGASRLFVNFFQPSFKLAEKHRDGAKVAKRYHPPLTPCERLLQSGGIPDVAKAKLREVSAELDPLKLLEEVRAVQAHLAALADGEMPPAMTAEPPDLATFVASLSSAWHAGEIRPTFSVEAKPRYLRSLQKVSAQTMTSGSATPPKPATPSVPASMPTVAPERPKLIYAQSGKARIQALRTVWPIVFRRLEALPNINAMQLFEELCFQFPGRFTVRLQHAATTRQSLASRRSRAGRSHRAEDLSANQRQTARQACGHLQRPLARDGAMS
jgi:hypothetical protein